MSILIRDMEMPKNCKDCPLSDHEAWCLIPGSWRERYYCPDDERSNDCPLIELPPHGRLGDLDKLNIHDISPVDGFCVMGVTEEDIELADTVIEAEGSET